MLFNSLDFAVFLPIVFICYWFLQKHFRAQNILIVLASYVFYGWWDYRFLLLIAFSTIIDYLVGIGLSKFKDIAKRKALLWLSITVNLGFLGFFKYFNFFLESFVDAFSIFGNKISVNSLDIILPVGISFYTFQTLSYSIDVYRNKLKPTKDFVAFSADVAISEDFDSFYEKELCLGNTSNMNTNIECLIKNLKGNYRKIIEKDPSILLHSDGWSDVSISVNPEFVKRRVKDKIASYNEKMIKNKFSKMRFSYLIKTIKFLKEKGEVFLVRLPIDPLLMAIENKYMPDFNKRIESATKLAPYLDLTGSNSRFTYTDGNHLYKTSGKEVSKQVAEWVKKNMQKIKK